MKKLSSTEAELKKSFPYKKRVIAFLTIKLYSKTKWNEKQINDKTVVSENCTDLDYKSPIAPSRHET